MKKFKHLNVPDHWQHYWTRYPEGYTILEALLNWVAQVDEMVDNQNKLNEVVENVVKNFDRNLQDRVIETLSEWQESGFLDVVIDQALQTQIDDVSELLAETVERLSDTEIVVKPNGVDDSDNIQMAINDLHSKGGGVLHLENGVYHISKPIVLYSYISIIGKGQGTVIRASERFTNGRFRGMLDLVSVEGVILKDIFLDHNGSNRIEGILSHTILMLNASKCRLENLTLSDCGSTASSIPTGPALAIIAKDKPTERIEETAEVYYSVIGSSSDNIVRNCRFESTKSARVAFAVRILTNWSEQRPLEDFIHHAERNVFDSCEFIGGFPWDTLEIAGGGSRYNKVTNCSFVGMTKTAIDFDKGANFNIAIGNTVVGAGIINEWLNDPSHRMAAIHVHGTGFPTALTYPCVGNIISNNIIRNVGNVNDTDIYQSAIAVGYSKDTIIEGNQIDGIIPDRGAGIFIDHQVETAVISKNVIRNTAYGIRENAASTTVSNIIISDNDIKSRRSGIYLDSSSSHECKIIGNRIESELVDVYNTRVVRAGHDGILISENTVIGGREGITVEANNSIVSNNIVKNADNYSFRVGANSRVYLIGNLSFNARFAPYIKSSSATIVDSANNFTVTQD